MQLDATITVTKNRREGGGEEVTVGLMRFGHKNTEASVEWQKIPGLSSCLPGNSHKIAESNERGAGGDGGKCEAVCQTILHTHWYIYCHLRGTY